MNLQSDYLTSGESYALVRQGNEGRVHVYRGVMHEFDSVDELQEFVESAADEILMVVNVPYDAVRHEGIPCAGENPILALEVDREKSTYHRVDNFIDEYGYREIEMGEVTHDLTLDEFREKEFDPAIKLIEGGVNYQIVPGFASRADITKTDDLAAIVQARGMSLIGDPYMSTTFVHEGSIFHTTTPERYLEKHSTGKIIVNPIAGTQRIYDDIGEFEKAMWEFINSKKEMRELAMLVSETAKDVVELCTSMGILKGPKLIQMGKVVHTVYEFHAQLDESATQFDMMKKCMHQPTVTGAPGRQAMVELARIEGESGVQRNYYSGFSGLVGKFFCKLGLNIRTSHVIKKEDENGKDVAYVGEAEEAGKEEWEVVFNAGAGITRPKKGKGHGSTAEGEYGEIGAKKASSISMYQNPPEEGGFVFEDHPLVNEWRQEVLKRNRTGNNYYLRRITKEIEQNRIRIPELENHEVVVIDFEDEFSDMLVDMMRRMGADVRKESWEDIDLKNPPDPSIMILGGGPGDINIKKPRPGGDPERMREWKRMQVARGLATDRIRRGRPTVGICLGLQAIGKSYDTKSVGRQPEQTMGLAKQVRTLVGNRQGDTRFAIAGFFNSFGVHPTSEIAQQAETSVMDFGEAGERHTVVHLRSNDGAICGTQFHPEAFETSGFKGNANKKDDLGGLEILRSDILWLMKNNLDIFHGAENNPEIMSAR